MNAAAELVNDPVDGGEDETRSFPLGFSRKEGLERVKTRLFIHAATCIRNL